MQELSECLPLKLGKNFSYEYDPSPASREQKKKKRGRSNFTRMPSLPLENLFYIFHTGGNIYNLSVVFAFYCIVNLVSAEKEYARYALLTTEK